MIAEFNLPGSSFEELQKIIKGYSHASDSASLGDLSKLVGLHQSIISRNAKFLVDINLVTAGKYKGATDTGKRLGRALEHSQAIDVQRNWREAVQSNDKVAGLVTTVRIKGGMTEKEFASHVLYVSGQNNNAGNKTGARCVTDILIAAGLLKEEGGKLVVASPSLPSVGDKADTDEANAEVAPVAESQTPPVQNSVQPAQQIVQAIGSVPQIAINIQLQLPETDNAEVYEKLFKALKDNLFPSPTE
jgi:hypothetical protein